MKRSEMIEKLNEAVDAWIDEASNKNVTEVILAEVERLGMSPPGYEGLMATGEKFDREKHSGRDTTWRRTWEPE